jgi:hypothetical protein
MIQLSELLNLLDTPEPPELGPEPRAAVLSEKELSRRLEALFAADGEKKELIRALILLWHDHLDASHSISQGIAGADGAFVHGIMHRREPDYGNAQYWFQRVEEHPSFSEIASRVARLLEESREQQLRDELLPNGKWNPFAFISACERAAGRPISDPQYSLMRKIQATESRALLESFVTS